MVYCPEWIYDAVIAQTAKDFISLDMPLITFARKYANGLAERYEAIPEEEIEAVAEEFIRTLDELGAGTESADLLNNFCYFRVMYSSQHVKRRLKPLFGTVDAGDKNKSYFMNETTKRFRAYIFATRSRVEVKADPGWTLAKVEELEWLGELVSKSVGLDDLL